MSKTRVRPIHRPRRVELMLAAAGSLLLAAVIGAGAAHAQDATAPTEATPAASLPADEAAAKSIDGTWQLTTEIGDFEDFTSSWVGFRVAEVLSNIGEAEAVGRTPVVSGELVVNGTTIESATISADLTGIRSDQSRRDPAIQRALETGEFPTATFTSAGAVDLGAVPEEGSPFSVTVPGTITIHGVEQEVALELTGQRVGDVAVVVGTLPLDFTSFGITMPTAPVVVSVADSGDLEWQLFFQRS